MLRRRSSQWQTTSASLSGGVVTSVTNEGVTTNYSRSVSGSTATMVVTNALSQATTIVSNLTSGRPTSVTDPLGHATSFTYDGSDRLTRTTAHEGNYVEHTYDARGNVTQTVAMPKSGTGATIVTSASFDSTCANPVTCNRPNSITDARGNVTDYTYDSTHGGVLTVTAPAPTIGAVRPQTRFSYTLTNGEYQLTGVSQCQTTASCAGTADEVKTAIAYNPDGNVYWTATGNGSATLVATTMMTYDAIGNLVTVDGPLSGTADTGRTRYNNARQVIGSVSPDPDGGGALKHRAVRNTYDSSTGLLTKSEQGNVNSQSDTDWAAFSAAQAVETIYDSNARPVVGKLISGSTVHALGQTSYDALGRPECSAQRMNPAVFATVTATSACTQGTGTGDYGPDRIAKAFYDLAGRVTEIKTALGTADEASEVRQSFTANGQVETVTDAEGNKTTYEYDGHDRLAKTRFPVATKGAGTSSTTDYEQPTYESLAGGTRTSGLVTAFRNRAAETIGLGHDALGRPTSKDLPGTEPDATYGYDLLGRMLSATQNGITIAFTWDALGRQLTQTIPIALIASPTFTSEYDLAGRRTRLIWPVDASSSTAYYVDYDYLVTGETDKIREKGATSGAGVLAAYGYDDLGRRTSLTRGNGAATSYQYDSASRLGQMTHDFGGSATTHDLTLGFAYNPASQILSTTRSNDLYAWTAHGSGTTSSTANGLNQLATHGGVTATSDAKGNFTFDGTYTYAYTSENLLTSFGATGTLEYDPLMRFYRNYSSYFIHDGAGAGQLLGEYYNGNVSARYVPGPGMDEPLALVSKTGARTWYHSDERGSIIGHSNDSGANARIVTYDEYGRSGSGGIGGRFGYTGQAHLLGGIYDYKSRNYNARLGRFLQTDTIGYGDGMNMYAYVGGDPVNFTDPSGLCAEGEHKVYDTGSRIGRCVKDGSGDGGGLANGYSGFSTAGVGGRSGGHYEYVKGHGPASTASDGSIVISADRVWVPDNWSFGSDPLRRVLRSDPAPYCEAVRAFGAAVEDAADEATGVLFDIGLLAAAAAPASGGATLTVTGAAATASGASNGVSMVGKLIQAAATGDRRRIGVTGFFAGFGSGASKSQVVKLIAGRAADQVQAYIESALPKPKCR